MEHYRDLCHYIRRVIILEVTIIVYSHMWPQIILCLRFFQHIQIYRWDKNRLFCCSLQKITYIYTNLKFLTFNSAHFQWILQQTSPINEASTFSTNSLFKPVQQYPCTIDNKLPDRIITIINLCVASHRSNCLFFSAPAFTPVTMYKSLNN